MRKFLIKVNGVQYEVECEEIFDGSDISQINNVMQEVSVPKTPVETKSEPKAAAPAPKPAQTGTVGSIKINSPMPGTIVDVLVKEGDAVQEGDTILILEAMKMENEIYAPKDGTIATVNVSKGSSVNVGDLLVSLN